MATGGPIEELLEAGRQAAAGGGHVLPDQPMTKRRKGHKLVLYLFSTASGATRGRTSVRRPTARSRSRWRSTGPVPSVALNQEEDVAEREKRKKAL